MRLLLVQGFGLEVSARLCHITCRTAAICVPFYKMLHDLCSRYKTSIRRNVHALLRNQKNLIELLLSCRSDKANLCRFCHNYGNMKTFEGFYITRYLTAQARALVVEVSYSSTKDVST